MLSLVKLSFGLELGRDWLDGGRFAAVQRVDMAVVAARSHKIRVGDTHRMTE